MCWNCIISGGRKVEILFKEPANTGFDVLIIGTLPSEADQKQISDKYKSHGPLYKYKGGIKEVLFYSNETDAGILHSTYGYTLTPFGACGIQKNIKEGLKSYGVTDFLKVQSDYNNLIRKDPENIQTILEDNGHI